MITIDARGFSCPIPVMKTQEEIKKNKPNELIVLVDNRVAETNVSRFAEGEGYNVTHEREGEDFKLILNK